MAGRILNRLKLRREADEASPQLPSVQAPQPTDEAPAPARAAKKAPRPRAPRKSKKAEPPRLRASWGVFDGSMKKVAAFDYNQRAAAEAKLAALLAAHKGLYFLQLVKMPIEPGEPATR